MVETVYSLTFKPSIAGIPKVPIALEKVRMKDASRAGFISGKVILRRIVKRLAPLICAISSRSPPIEESADETNK